MIIIIFSLLSFLAQSATATDTDIFKPGTEAYRRDIERMTQRLESEELRRQKQPERVMRDLDIKPGEVIADIGAGTGMFAFLLAEAVGATGTVYAVEILKEMRDFIAQKAKSKGVTNMIILESSTLDPMLPPGCCDRLLLSSVYQHLKDKVVFMKHARRALKPGGTVVLISPDPKMFVNTPLADPKNNPHIPPSKAEITKEMKQAGFVFVKSYGYLKQKYFLIYKRLR